MNKKRLIMSCLGILSLIAVSNSIKTQSTAPLEDNGSCYGERFRCRATAISINERSIIWEDNQTLTTFYTNKKSNVRLGLTHLIEVSNEQLNNVGELKSAEPIADTITIFCSTKVPKKYRGVLPGPAGEENFIVPVRVDNIPRRPGYSYGQPTHFLFNGEIDGTYITPEEANAYGMNQNCPQVLEIQNQQQQ